jgi:hypothetical protein
MTWEVAQRFALHCIMLLQVADFLARDFSSAEGRAAASKNAFHLLGQHRYSLAAGEALTLYHHLCIKLLLSLLFLLNVIMLLLALSFNTSG